jgi:hypothetical protein
MDPSALRGTSESLVIESQQTWIRREGMVAGMTATRGHEVWSRVAFNDPRENRTPVTRLRTWCPSR